MQHIRLLVILSLISAATPILAASQELNRSNFSASICNIESMVIWFNLEELFDEPVLSSRMKWQAGANTRSDCLSGTTRFFLKMDARPEGSLFVKLTPEISFSGENFSDTRVESPSWNALFCFSMEDFSHCVGAARAREILNDMPTVEHFQVVTQSTALGQLPEVATRQSEDKLEFGLDLKSLLEQTIDSSLEDLSALEADVAATPVVDPEEQRRLAELGAREDAMQLELQRLEEAKSASAGVLALISSSLAEYRTPAHNCESPRSALNWVQIPEVCQLNFRRESKHEYLCTKSGQPRPVVTTHSARVNFGNDIDQFLPVRVSESWVSFGLEFRNEGESNGKANPGIKRWQFTAPKAALSDMENLARHFEILQSYCENRKSSRTP